MMKFKMTTNDRKELVNRLSELSGERPVYTKIPRMAYIVGSYTVERNGELVAGAGADRGILDTLVREGLIGSAAEAPEADGPEAGTEADGPAEEAAPASVEDDAAEGHDGEICETGAEETDAGAGDGSDGQADGEEAEEPEAGEGEHDGTAFPLDTTISFPMDRHSAESLRNLVCMVYTRGHLLSKATGGDFHVEQDFVEALLSEGFLTAEDVAAFITEWEGGEPLTGLSFKDGKVNFTGFKGTEDGEHIRAFAALASAMNKSALRQKRVRAKVSDEPNEKYAFRTWLVRIGLGGTDHKAERKLLLEKLDGHTAFRTPADAEKWKARQQAKKEELMKGMGFEAQEG